VVEFVVRGASTRQISQALDVTEDTVQKHLQNVFEKVGDRSRQELIKRLYLNTIFPSSLGHFRVASATRG
jgi:DNA-binding CsgD family transcriptional regulator